MHTYTSQSETELHTTRRALINKDVQVSMIALNPATDLYTFNTVK